jgi:hypothetical protein
MKRLILAAIALPLTWAGAYAQGIHIGPGGVGIDTGVRTWGHREVIRQYEDSDGCMVRVIRYHRPDGDVVTRRTRDCD